MSEHDLGALRRGGFAVAYRMLGSVADAEDVAQEALLRLHRAEQEIAQPAAWITTVATRLAIDHLRLARVRREQYVGPWLPDPLLEDPAPGPGARLELADSLSQAFLVVLETLTPVERAAFLLRDVFDYPYEQIAEVIDRTDDHARQLVSRARRHVAARTPRFDPDPSRRDALLERFLAAADNGDLAGLETLLAAEAVLYSDGGGKALAAPEPVVGAAAIARFMAEIARKQRAAGSFERVLGTVNGQPGRLLRLPDGTAWDVLAIDVVDGRIAAVRIVRNPDKLGHL